MSRYNPQEIEAKWQKKYEPETLEVFNFTSPVSEPCFFFVNFSVGGLF